MRVLLIYPPITTNKNDPTFIRLTPPLGLGYIASVLEKEGIEVKILDAVVTGTIRKKNNFIYYGLTDEEIKKYIENYNPGIVGISSQFTSFSKNAHRTAKITKEINKDILVVFGGAHSTACSDFILNGDKNVDVIVKGEGEFTMLELSQRIIKKKSIFNISGIKIRKNGKIIDNPNRAYIENLDSLPFPARHLLPMKLYFENYKWWNMRNPCTTLISSRGCPGNCTFCSIHSIWGHKWRARSATNVLDEMEFLIEKYGIREFDFLDDNMGINKKRMMEICDGIKERNMDIKWKLPNGIGHWTLDKKVLKKMKDSGCYKVTFGIESANLETRRFIGKLHDLNQAKKLLKTANNLGFWTMGTFIIGFPYEPKESINDTINFAIKSEFDMPIIYLLAAFPGTPVYEICKKEGMIKNNDYLSFSYYRGGLPHTKYFTREELHKIIDDAHKEIIKKQILRHLNPFYMRKKINSFEDLRFLSKLVKNYMISLIKSIKYGVMTPKAIFK